MTDVVLRIDKEKHVYIPIHKHWVQLFKQQPIENQKFEESIGEDGEIIKSIKEWLYYGKQIKYNEEWEGHIDSEYEEETEMPVIKYIYQNFDEIWDNN